MLGSDCLLLLVLVGSASFLFTSVESNFSAESGFASEPDFPAKFDFSAWFGTYNSLPLLKVMALIFLRLVTVWEGRLLEP